MPRSHPPSRWRPRPMPGLPDGLILFDGVCVLCSAWARFVVERDRAGVFRFAAIQSPLGRSMAQQLGIDPDDPESNAVVIGATVYLKSDAVLTVLSRLPGWGFARVLAALPRGLRDFLYDRVARNRYAIFGRTDTCMVPGPALKKRFVAGGPP